MAYSDKWVVDNTLFQYISHGSCSCCGDSHALMMNSALLKDMLSDMSTDGARREEALSPWPPCMEEELLKDRVKIRVHLKAKLPYYQKFVAENFEVFSQWWTHMSNVEKRKIFVMPVDEVKVTYEVQMDVRKAYNVLLSSVLEQVKRFPETHYKADGAIPCEVAFEQALRFKHGAFVVAPDYYSSSSCSSSSASDTPTDKGEGETRMVLPSSLASSCSSPSFFLDMVKQVGNAASSSLLPKAMKKRKDTEQDREAFHENEFLEEGLAPSFKGDRRLIRLVIFRYFLDRAIRLFHEARD